MDGQMFIINQYYEVTNKKKGENYLVDTTDVFGSSYNVEHFEDIVKNSTINYKK